MNRTFLCRAFLFLTVVSFARDSAAAWGGFTLVDKGKPACSIVIAEKPTRSVQVAAGELQSYVKKITGATLPIVSDAQNVDGARILVGESAFTRKLGFKNADFAKQEYIIRTSFRTLLLMGRDEEDYGEVNYADQGIWVRKNLPREPKEYVANWVYTRFKECEEALGSCYAVDAFLEKCCGVRWYLPTEIGEVVPFTATLSVKAVNIRRCPSTVFRCASEIMMTPKTLYYLDGKKYGYTWLNLRDISLWVLRMKGLGWDYFPACHSLYWYYTRFYKDHPEWFVPRPGFRPNDWNLKYDDPGVIRQIVQDARDSFDGKEIQGVVASSKYFSVMPMDQGNYTDTGYQPASLEPEETRKLKRKGIYSFWSGTASNYIWGLVNAVAKEVGRTHPDKLITCVAYYDYFEPPDKVALEPNVAVEVCQNVMTRYLEGEEARDHNTLKEWCKRVKKVYIWEYYNFPNFWNNDQFPILRPHKIAEDIELYRQLGIQGVFIELNNGLANRVTDHLNLYVTYKLLDDWNQNVDDILDEYYRLFYGPAEKPMKEFFRRMEEASTNPKNFRYLRERGLAHLESRTSWEIMCPLNELKIYGQLIQEAYALAPAGPFRERVALMDQGIYRHLVNHCTDYWARKGVISALKTTCPSVEEKPVIDGMLDEAVWKKARKIYAFTDFLDKGKKPEVTTEAFLMHDQDTFSIGVVCDDPALKSAGVYPAFGRDDRRIFDDDSVEVFLDPGYTRLNYKQMVIGIGGNRWDMSYLTDGADRRADLLWNCPGSCAVKVYNGKWVMEMSVPIREFSGQPLAKGDVWGINICRNRPKSPQRYLTWSPIPTSASFHSPADFIALTFE